MVSMRTETEMDTRNGNQVERKAWAASNMELTAAELENLLRNIDNIDQRDLVAPLREARNSLDRLRPETGKKCREAMALQERWNAWLVERDVLREEIKRGKECREQVQEDLAATRASL